MFTAAAEYSLNKKTTKKKKSTALPLSCVRIFSQNRHTHTHTHITFSRLLPLFSSQVESNGIVNVTAREKWDLDPGRVQFIHLTHSNCCPSDVKFFLLFSRRVEKKKKFGKFLVETEDEKSNTITLRLHSIIMKGLRKTK
jgi:hypothetical protein